MFSRLNITFKPYKRVQDYDLIFSHFAILRSYFSPFAMMQHSAIRLFSVVDMLFSL